jgi:hypothetical protein
VRARHLASDPSPPGSIPRPKSFRFRGSPAAGRPKLAFSDQTDRRSSVMTPHLSFTECTKAGSVSPDQRPISVSGWRRQAQSPGRLDEPDGPPALINPCVPNRDRRHAGSSTSRSSYQEARLARSCANLMLPKALSGATSNARMAWRAPAFRLPSGPGFRAPVDTRKASQYLRYILAV